MFSIHIDNLNKPIEEYINNIELYWLEQNKTIKLYSYHFKCIKHDDNSNVFAFTFSTFTNGNFEVKINWKDTTNIKKYNLCRISFIQIFNKDTPDEERHMISKTITDINTTIYISNIPYESIFGIDHEKIKLRDKSKQHKIKWHENIIEFISNKKLLQKQHQYSLKLFWNVYWFQLHILSIHYPEKPSDEDKKEILNLLHAMQHGGIPCNICNQHFILWKEFYPPDMYLNSREKIKHYFINLHNDVNKRNKKKIFTKNDFVERFESDTGSKYIMKQIETFGLDILSMFKNRELKTFPDLYIKHGLPSIQKYVLTIPNFESMIL